MGNVLKYTSKFEQHIYFYRNMWFCCDKIQLSTKRAGFWKNRLLFTIVIKYLYPPKGLAVKNRCITCLEHLHIIYYRYSIGQIKYRWLQKSESTSPNIKEVFYDPTKNTSRYYYLTVANQIAPSNLVPRGIFCSIGRCDSI